VGNDAVQASLGDRITASNLALLDKMPQVPVANHAFRNDGGMRFTDMAAAWGLGEPGFSNGAAYADLNNSGSLDLVVNRVNAPAAIYRNRSRERNANGSITVVLRGAGGNRAGIGARVTVHQGGARQLLEQQPTRGFQSSVDPRLHFGLGRAARVDSLRVVWPDGRTQLVAGVAANATVTLVQDSARAEPRPALAAAAPLLADITDSLPIDYRHRENDFNDFDREPLMPRQLSAEGPALAVGDVDGDGLEDLFLGGAKWQPARVALQRREGGFAASAQPALAADSLSEDVDADFVDVDRDGDQDLVVVSGGNEFWDDAPALRVRLYRNDGRGALVAAPEAIPGVFVNGGCVEAADYDGDGDVDLFVGGRVVSRRYGETPRSYLLRNDGRGNFADATARVAPALGAAGMVSSAAWLDYDADGRLDLVVVGEWMPVRVFRQEGGRLGRAHRARGLAASSGWWNSVSAADLDADGRPDLVLGNLGRNSYIRASAAEPARLYVHDFGGNGSLEQVLTFYKQGESYPLAGRDELVRLVPSLRSRYPSYASFGASRVEDIFPAAELRAARVLEARTFETSVALNDGRGGFGLAPLPVEAQLAPVYATHAQDLDGDGTTDLLLAGNLHGVPAGAGAVRRQLRRGAARARGGRFAAVDPTAAGVAIEGQARRMRPLRHREGGHLIVVARNDSTLQLLRPTRDAEDRP
jgi:hypothetical protein